MVHANEQDVVLAFRQAVEEELRHSQENPAPQEPVFASGDSTEDSLRKLAARYENLEHEVALLRTIILKLISEPVDANNEIPMD
ncbi:MAG TPA: hypothetical protein VF681_02790 [Abditibacteriaceae bacterium]|jgi:hypothetical protein